MSRVCWNGCSFTFGEGFPENQRDEFIYRSLVDKHFGFTSDMIATPGASNYMIFMRSLEAIISNKYDIVFTQWSGLNRLWLYPGPDAEFCVNSKKDNDFTYRNIYLSSKDQQKLKDQISMLNHDYHNILELIRYCNILESLSVDRKTKLVFINGLVPWTNDLNTDIDLTDLNSALSHYTKLVLDFNNRDDSEITDFFKELQKEFATLNQSLWVNLFNSMYTMATDVGPDGHHPGIQTHQWMYNKVSTYLQEYK